MQQICSRYAADMWQICSRYAADMQQICSRYTADMQQIYSRYAADMQQIYSRNAADMRQICSRYAHVPTQKTHVCKVFTCFAAAQPWQIYMLIKMRALIESHLPCIFVLTYGTKNFKLCSRMFQVDVLISK